MAKSLDECEQDGDECCHQYPNFCCGCPMPTQEERKAGPTVETLRKGLKHLLLTAQGVNKAYNQLFPPK
jgi:hypothetical protein